MKSKKYTHVYRAGFTNEQNIYLERLRRRRRRLKAAGIRDCVEYCRQLGFPSFAPARKVRPRRAYKPRSGHRGKRTAGLLSLSDVWVQHKTGAY